MQAKRLQLGQTIGIFCPSHVADMTRYSSAIQAIEQLGFKVKLGKNMQKDTYGYAASAEERAEDLNALVADESVQMIMFNGGSSAVEILPLIDYDKIRKNPKLFSSYSDGTSILNAIYTQTGLVTYYGMCAGNFSDLRHYDYMQFCTHFVWGNTAEKFVSNSKWRAICGGSCEGTLIGGYSSLFGLMLSNSRFAYDTDKKYILFIEDLEKFSSTGQIATYLAFIGQSVFMKNVSGLIFGHYSDNVSQEFIHMLERFGKLHDIPVVYTDDFGHGTQHGILPIGAESRLDADKGELWFL